MLYLEDYLEMIEHLPQELRDRFTEMRELDLTVQNNMDSLEKKTRSFLLQCKRGELQNESFDIEYQNLRKEYYKVLEDADEKVAIATQVHELVERYLRKLDSELFKFKCELEADNNGITEILEKRSLEMDGGGSSAATALMNVIGMSRKENRYYAMAAMGHSGGGNGAGNGSTGAGSLFSSHMLTAKDNRYRATTLRPEKRRDSNNAGASLTSIGPLEKRPNLGTGLIPTNAAAVRPITPGIGAAHAILSPAVGAVAATGATAIAYNMPPLAGSLTSSSSAALASASASTSNAIVGAASGQAVMMSSTAQNSTQHGRRASNLKTNYEAIHGAGGGPTEFWISRDIANAAAAAAAAHNTGVGVSDKKQKKKSTILALASGSGVGGNAITAAMSSSSALSMASSSSSVSVDSMDMLPSTSAAAGGVAAASLGLSVMGANGVANAAATVASRSNIASTSAAAAAAAAAAAITNDITLNENGLVVEQTAEGEWSYDPNEPRYCTCNQVSYGDMVACDNDACPYEWFHYPCVGITQPPKGKWYCPKCTASMRRRGNRKN